MTKSRGGSPAPNDRGGTARPRRHFIDSAECGTHLAFRTFFQFFHPASTDFNLLTENETGQVLEELAHQGFRLLCITCKDISQYCKIKLLTRSLNLMWIN